MTLALNSLAIFLFIITPGIAFRRFYFQGEFTKQFNSKSLAHSIASSILPGLIIQVSSIILYKKYINKIELNSISDFYSQLSSNQIPVGVFDFDILKLILEYVILMFVLSFLFATICWYIIRLIKADRWWKIMRFSNHWNYYFNGELRGFPEYKGLINGDLISVRSDVLINVSNESPRLYSGILKQHTINSKTLELDNIYLSDAHIWKANKKTGLKERKSIAGDLMILKACDIININLHYVTVPKSKPDYSDWFGLITLLFVAYMFFTDYEYFNSSTVFKTFLIKLFFIIEFILILIVIDGSFKLSRSSVKKREILGVIIFMIILAIAYSLLKYFFS